MEEVQGVPIREAPEGAERTEAARQLLESYYRQILTDGFFHADPHPGNMKWWNDRIYFLDFGMVGEVDAGDARAAPAAPDGLLARRRPLPHGRAAHARRATSSAPTSTSAACRRSSARSSPASATPSLQEIQLGPILQGITEIAARHDVRLPSSLALTGKALAQMQLATAELDPTLDPFAVAGSYLFKTFTGRLRDGADPQRAALRRPEAEGPPDPARRGCRAAGRSAGRGRSCRCSSPGTERLEDTIRKAARRVSLAIASGTSIIATGVTANSTQVGDWLPITLGTVGGVLAVGLVLDLLRR